jgi:hypothetical protein
LKLRPGVANRTRSAPEQRVQHRTQLCIAHRMITAESKQTRISAARPDNTEGQHSKPSTRGQPIHPPSFPSFVLLCWLVQYETPHDRPWVELKFCYMHTLLCPTCSSSIRLTFASNLGSSCEQRRREIRVIGPLKSSQELSKLPAHTTRRLSLAFRVRRFTIRAKARGRIVIALAWTLSPTRFGFSTCGGFTNNASKGN